jgi:hypothetical protein
MTVKASTIDIDGSEGRGVLIVPEDNEQDHTVTLRVAQGGPVAFGFDSSGSSTAYFDELTLKLPRGEELWAFDGGDGDPHSVLAVVVSGA